MPHKKDDQAFTQRPVSFRHQTRTMGQVGVLQPRSDSQSPTTSSGVNPADWRTPRSLGKMIPSALGQDCLEPQRQPSRRGIHFAHRANRTSTQKAAPRSGHIPEGWRRPVGLCLATRRGRVYTGCAKRRPASLGSGDLPIQPTNTLSPVSVSSRMHQVLAEHPSSFDEFVSSPSCA